MDEAWLHRAPLPDGCNRSSRDPRPVDRDLQVRCRSTNPTIRCATTAAGLPADPALRRGKSILEARAGTGAGLRRCNRASTSCPGSRRLGLQCEAARDRSRVRASSSPRAPRSGMPGGGGYWARSLRGAVRRMPRRPRSHGARQALVCRRRSGAHGSRKRSPGTDRRLADPYIFYAGNFLNYLRGRMRATDRPIAELIPSGLAQALAATGELDVALIRVDDNGPDGGFVARAPAASELAAAEVLAIWATPPAGSAPLAETLTEAARWLQGGPKRFGLDERTDPAAVDPLAPRPVSVAVRVTPAGRSPLAYLTAGEPSGDEQAAAAASGLHALRRTDRRLRNGLPRRNRHWLASTDLRDDLPGAQSAPVTWIPPSPAPPAISGNLIARRSARLCQPGRARISARRRGRRPSALSAAALMPFDSVARRTRRHLRSHRATSQGTMVGQLAALCAAGARRARSSRRSSSIATARPQSINRMACRAKYTQPLERRARSNLLAGGAAGRLPDADARRIHTDIATGRLLDPANRLEPGNAHIGRRAVGLGPLDPETLDDVLPGRRHNGRSATPALHCADRRRLPGSPPCGRICGDPGRHAARFRRRERRRALGMDAEGDAAAPPGSRAQRSRRPCAAMASMVRSSCTATTRTATDASTAATEITCGCSLDLAAAATRYYALDVALPTDPRLLWSIALPDAGVGRAEPVVARLEIADSGQSAGDWIVLLAGGYDRRFDAGSRRQRPPAMRCSPIDATTGRDAVVRRRHGPDLAIAGLASLAAAPRLLDLDGDGHIDRGYVLDVVGSLWRIDFEDGREPARLASAVRLARLGTGAHRFHFTPDISIARIGDRNPARDRGGLRLALAPARCDDRGPSLVVFDEIRGRPARSLECRSPRCHARDGRIASGCTGLVRPARRPWHGRKGRRLRPSLSITCCGSRPISRCAADPAAPCGPPRSVARHYALDIRTALPHATAVESEDEEPEEIVASGLPPGLRFGFPGRWDEACDGCTPRPFGILGGETFDPGYAGDPVRTSWRKLVPPPDSP